MVTYNRRMTCGVHKFVDAGMSRCQIDTNRRETFCEHYSPEAITPMGKVRLGSLENSVHGVARGHHTTANSESSYTSCALTTMCLGSLSWLPLPVRNWCHLGDSPIRGMARLCLGVWLAPLIVAFHRVAYVYCLCLRLSFAFSPLMPLLTASMCIPPCGPVTPVRVYAQVNPILYAVVPWSDIR